MQKNLDLEENCALKYKYPNFIYRTLAGLIDGILLLVSWFLLSMIELRLIAMCIGLYSGLKYPGLSYLEVSKIINPIIESLFENPMVYFFVFIQCILIYSALESSLWKSSIGKRIFKIIVIDERGNQLTFSRAVFRNMLKIVNFLVLGIGYINIYFSPKKQALHDKFSGSIVIKEH